MMTVELLPADEHNHRTINQSHPPNWQNPPGGDYDLVVLGGGPARLVAALTAAAGGGHRVAMTERRLTGVSPRPVSLHPRPPGVAHRACPPRSTRWRQMALMTAPPPRARFRLSMRAD